MGDSPQQVPTSQASPWQYSSFSGSSAPWAKLLSQQPSQQLSQQFQSGQSQPSASVPAQQPAASTLVQQSYYDPRHMPVMLPQQQQQQPIQQVSDPRHMPVMSPQQQQYSPQAQALLQMRGGRM